jgi:DUF4097 and DUF4098 domain-containing protein YvlB
MSLNEEKILILKMLEEGKITSEEAARLLEALEGGIGHTSGGKYGAGKNKQSSFYDEISKVKDRINDWKKEIKKSYNQKDFDRMVEEFSAKAEKLGKNVASATFNIVDKVVEFVGSFVDTSAFNIFGSYLAVERTFDVPASEGMDLNIDGINGHILVKKHLENKVIIKTTVRSLSDNADEILEFYNDENLISLKINKTGNISVSHEIFLPALKFNMIRFETINGKVYVEDAVFNEFSAATKNSPIDLTGLKGDRINVTAKNSKVQISYLIGNNVSINTNNSVIDIKNIKGENIEAVTVNGRVTLENIQNYEDSPEVNLFLKTSNGGIRVNMNDMDSRGYKIKGRAARGSINLLIPELIYHNINKQGADGSFIEAESNGYETYAQRVCINAETVNGDIEVIK